MLPELFDRWVTAVGAHPIGAAAAVTGMTLWAACTRRLPMLMARPAITRSVLTLAVVGGALWAWHLAWVADDAFISFRYARHLAEGHGLVYNPGERVEGYTNFLWTLLASLAITAGASPVESALGLSLASFAAVVVGTHRVVAAWSPPASRGVPSASALVVAASYSMASFATSGLETMFAAALALWAIERVEAGAPTAAGWLAGLAILAHPDHALFAAGIGAALVSLRGAGFRSLVRFAAPVAALGVPWFVWRWAYYGDPLPNTYYAKLGDAAYFGQGAVFLAVCAVALGIAPLVPLVIAGAAARWDRAGVRAVAIGVPIYLVYVAKIGGDFMLARLLVPVVPPVLALAEVAARRLLEGTSASGARRVALAASLVALALPAVPARLLAPRERAFLVADERTFYPLVSLRPLDVDSMHFRFAKVVESFFEPRGARPRVAVGSVGISGYLTGLPMIDLYGLTDRTIARQGIRSRGLPGHEKRASAGYLHAREVDLSEMPVFPAPWAELTRFRVGEIALWAGRFDGALFDRLAGPPVEWLDVRAKLDAYEPTGRSQERVECDAWFFDRYYFSASQDGARREGLASKIARAHPALATVAPFLVDDAPRRAVREMALEPSFESSDGAVEAFEPWPRPAPVPGEPLVAGLDGTPVSSFGVLFGAAARGTLTSRPFVLRGDVAVVRVAGGRSARGVGVRLVVDGRLVGAASGCDSSIARRAAWDVSGLQGRSAVLELVDDSTTHHVVVGHLQLWRRLG